MRKLAIALGLGVAAGCGPDNGDGADELPVIPDTIEGCDVADRGVLNLWLMGHGLPPDVDAIPAPEPGWATYSDPQIPLFSFSYPPAWAAVNLDDGVFAGFGLASPDERSLMKFGSVLAPSTSLTPGDITAAEYGGVFGNAVGTLRCSAEFDSVTAVGAAAALRVVEVDVGAYFVISASTYYDPDGRFGYAPGQTMNAAIRWFAAPTGEFAARTDEVFLPVIYQFFYGSSNDLEDRDGDGVPDVSDNFPDDASRA